jgi:methylglyoxal synthase
MIFKNQYDLALYADDTRIEDLVLLINAHIEELSGIKIVCGCQIAALVKPGVPLDITYRETARSAWLTALPALINENRVKTAVYLPDLSGRESAIDEFWEIIQAGIKQNTPVAVNWLWLSCYHLLLNSRKPERPSSGGPVTG